MRGTHRSMDRTSRRSFRCYIGAMKTARPPSRWLDLQKGDSIHTKVRFHQIDRYLGQMEGMGYKFELNESKSGYRLLCTLSPHDKAKRPKLRLVKG